MKFLRSLFIIVPLLCCGAAYFDGSTTGDGTSGNIDAIGTNILSISYWVKHSTTNVGTVMEHSTNVGIGTRALPRWGVYRGDSAANSEDFAIKANGWRYEWVAGNVTGVWKHRVVVYDMSTANGDIVVYTNGIAAGTTIRLNTLSATNAPFDAAHRFYFGKRSGSTDRITGFLQDVAIYAGTVSSDEAYRLGAQRMSPLKVRSAKLLYYWPFSAGEDAGNSPDLVGGRPANNGTKFIVQDQAPTYRK